MSEYRIEDLPVRIADKILVNRDTGCWEWQGYRTPKGYGTVAQREPSGKVRVHRVHRFVYELLVGPIPPGLTLDHVKTLGCTSKACCWPDHLEPVTDAENNRRARTLVAVNAAKTHCDQGHEFDLVNTYFRSDGKRDCRECQRKKDRRRNRKGRNRKAA